MSILNINAITPKQMYKELDIMSKLREPALMHGSPGCGKSTVVADWCSANKYNLTVRMLSQLAPGDLLIPYVEQESGILRYAVADWLMDLGKEGPHVLFLDEFDKIAPDVRTSVYQILLDRRLAHWRMPDNVFVVAAGNLITDNAGGYDTDTALADRVSHFLIKTDPIQWIEWGTENNIHPAVLTFIKNRADMLDDVDNFEDIVRVSPRSWEKVSNILHIENNPDLVATQIAARIGVQNTAVFLQTLQEIRSLPDLGLLLKASDEELVRYGREIFDTNSKVYGLAYHLHAVSNSVKSLARASRIFVNVCKGVALSSATELQTMGLGLFIQKSFTKKWMIKLVDSEDFMNGPYQAIESTPDLKSLIDSNR